MKHLFITLFLIISVTTLAQTAYPTGVTGCIARWNFTHTGAITSLPDVSGNGNNGSAVNLTSANAFRTVPSKAMLFNGSSSYSQVTHSSLLTPSNMTMIALVKLNGYNSNNCQFTQFLLKGYPHGSTGCYGIGVGDNTFDGSCSSYSPSNQQLESHYGTSSHSHAAGNYIQTGKWYFIATSFSTGTVKYYQVEMDSNAFATALPPIYTMTGVSGSIGSNTSDIAIGRTFNPPFPNWVNGSIDELVMFNRVLSDSEVHNVYHYLWGDIFISTTDTILCSTKNTFTVNYTPHNPDHFLSGNVFNVELSNAAGSFVSPVVIGSATSSTAGSILCTIPGGTPTGAGYKIRVTSTNRPIISRETISIQYSSSLYTPVVSIAATPVGPVVSKGTTVTFTATPVFGGAVPSYKWKKNNVIIAGATLSTYSAVAGVGFISGDSISVSMTSNLQCAFSDETHSNKIGYNVDETSIAGLNDFEFFVLQPNPNNGTFSIQGKVMTNKPVSAIIYSTLGQEIYSETIAPVKNNINHTIRLNDITHGMYFLHLRSGVSNKTIKFFVDR